MCVFVVCMCVGVGVGVVGNGGGPKLLSCIHVGLCKLRQWEHGDKQLGGRYTLLWALGGASPTLHSCTRRSCHTQHTICPGLALPCHASTPLAPVTVVLVCVPRRVLRCTSHPRRVYLACTSRTCCCTRLCGPGCLPCYGIHHQGLPALACIRLAQLCWFTSGAGALLCHGYLPCCVHPHQPEGLPCMQWHQG